MNTVTTKTRIVGINADLDKEYFRTNDDPGLKYKFTVVEYMVGGPVRMKLHQFETCCEAANYIYLNDVEFMSFNIFLNRSDGKMQKITDEETRMIMDYEEMEYLTEEHLTEDYLIEEHLTEDQYQAPPKDTVEIVESNRMCIEELC